MNFMTLGTKLFLRKSNVHHYEYHASALVEAIGAVNALEFNRHLHNQAAVIGILSRNGFTVRGVLHDDLTSLVEHSQLPSTLSFKHPDIVEAFLVYYTEIDMLALTEGSHPGLGEDIKEYAAVEVLDDWSEMSEDDLCIQLLTDLGEDEDEAMDLALLEDLESCFPLTDEQRVELADMVVRFMDLPDEPTDSND